MKKISIICLGVILNSSCIEKYVDYGDGNMPITVVDGFICNKMEKQKIVLSKSVAAGYPEFVPIIGCKVEVRDINRNKYIFNELDSLPGTYSGQIDSNAFYDGNKFCLHFTTYEGVEYESFYEEYQEVSPIDTVYFEISLNSQVSDESQMHFDGIRFYAGITKDNNYCNYSKFKLIETFEYHSTWPITQYWNGVMNYSQDYSKYICYKTNEISDIYVSDLSYLTNGSFAYLPLNFVSNQTQRLMHRYSLNVERHSLSEEAYLFWLNLQKNQYEGGGLFDSQPINVQGNVVCVSNPNVKVLGFFTISAVTSKRIFVSNLTQLKFNYDDIFCEALNVDFESFESRVMFSSSHEWPIYIPPKPDDYEQDRYDYYVSFKDCFDCTLKGGTVNPPDFWIK